MTTSTEQRRRPRRQLTVDKRQVRRSRRTERLDTVVDRRSPSGKRTYAN